MTPRYHLDEIPDREPAPALLRYRTRNPRGTPVPGAERDRMELTALLVTLIIGAVAGWLAGLIVKGYGFGIIGNIVVVLGGTSADCAGFAVDRQQLRDVATTRLGAGLQQLVHLRQ